MSASFVSEKDRLDYVNTGAVAISRGDIVVSGEFIGVALGSIAIGDTGVIKTDGVWDIDALSTAVFSIGAIVYYDTTNKQCVETKTDTTPLIGYAALAKAAGDTTVRVVLRPE